MVKRDVKLMILSWRLLSRCPDKHCPECGKHFTEAGTRVWRSSGAEWYCEDHYWTEVKEEKKDASR